MRPTECSRSIGLQGGVSSPPSVANRSRLLHYQGGDPDVLQASSHRQATLSSTKDNCSILHHISPLKRSVDGRVPDVVMLCHSAQTIHDGHERPGFPHAAVCLNEGEDTSTFGYDGLKANNPLHKDLIETSASNPDVRYDLESCGPRNSYTCG